MGSYAVEIGLLRLLRAAGTITEKEYRGICEVAFKHTGSALFLL
jgi:hypothetical protein